MSSRNWPDGPYCPARKEVNSRIRRLMAQPPDERRADAYERLLRQWAEGCHRCRYVQAA